MIRIESQYQHIMKLKLIIYRAVMAGWMTSPVLAEEPKSSADNYRQTTNRVHGDRTHLTSRYNQLGQVEKASELIGTEVKNYQGDKLGKVDELAVDVEGGRIATAIISVGGFLGIGDTLIAVPPSALHLDRPNKVVHLDADKTKLKAAPKVDLSKWNECCDSARLSEVYQYYGQPTYFGAATRSENLRDTDAPGGVDAGRNRDHVRPGSAGYVARGTKVIGMSVKNPQDESLGKVENLMVDIAAGRVVAVIVSTGGFLGLGDELSAVPPSAFHFNPERNILLLDATKDSLARSPHFKSAEWPDLAEPTYTEGVYRAYRVEPYFKKDADNTAQNVRDRDRQTLTPLDQGNNKADIDTSAQIRKDILADKTMSLNARNVKIITANGRVTLRGVVNTDEEKRRIAEIAGNIATQNVDNQLQVKTK